MKAREPKYVSGPAALFVAAAARESNNKPDFVLSILMSSYDGRKGEVIAVKFGETGYYKTSYGPQAEAWVVEQNGRMGIDEATRMAFETCSLFGNWSNYDNVLMHVRDAMQKRGGHVG